MRYPICKKCGLEDSPNHRAGVLHRRYQDIQRQIAAGWARPRMADALGISINRVALILRHFRTPKQDEYRTKLSVLLEHMDAGRWDDALKMAAKFGSLGEHKKAITRGASALIHPEFHKQLGKDPEALVQEGIEALKARYWKEKK